MSGFLYAKLKCTTTAERGKIKKCGKIKRYRCKVKRFKAKLKSAGAKCNCITLGYYLDEAKTGTKDTRASFQRLLKDCRAGKIDLVITKTISRFARNTVTLLTTVRELKELGIDVFFEEQNIHSVSGDGELMLSILASYAQEESLSVSENQKWRVRRNFENGLPWNCTVLGYRYRNGRFEVVPEEAETVKRIFHEYLSGSGTERIVKGLILDGVPTRRDAVWSKWAVTCMSRR